MFALSNSFPDSCTLSNLSLLLKFQIGNPLTVDGSCWPVSIFLNKNISLLNLVMKFLTILKECVNKMLVVDSVKLFNSLFAVLISSLWDFFHLILDLSAAKCSSCKILWAIDKTPLNLSSFVSMVVRRASCLFIKVSACSRFAGVSSLLNKCSLHHPKSSWYLDLYPGSLRSNSNLAY